ncbi:hypothetical protein F8M49_03375 [Rhodococcus zopfii]|uniref:Condensation domain-containing protein n=1 Tax=Rhodococcus zopfii TaxID=43772 RepID=A0ABU3WL20_9NOCA|nr:hypothetical protein [Rhodococcus zopfii]
MPLSLAQQRMWFLNRFDPASGSYNIPLAIRLSGALDVAALQGAVGDVIGRHEILRTVYPERDGTGHQVVLPVAEALPDLAPPAGRCGRAARSGSRAGIGRVRCDRGDSGPDRIVRDQRDRTRPRSGHAPHQRRRFLARPADP